jgi:protein ImuA
LKAWREQVALAQAPQHRPVAPRQDARHEQWRSEAERAAGEEPTAAVTRWRITPAPSPGPRRSLGRPRWRVELLRVKGAAPGSWIVEACDAKGRVRVPADLADRPHPLEEPLRVAAE